jgi:hypothetical protein
VADDVAVEIDVGLGVNGDADELGREGHGGRKWREAWTTERAGVERADEAREFFFADRIELWICRRGEVSVGFSNAIFS